MAQFHDLQAMLDQLALPAFFVKDGRIQGCNTAAAQRFAAPGMQIEPLLLTGQEEYRQFTDGELYLSICLAGTTYRCCITPIEQMQLFTLDIEQQNDQLQILALAAMQLRIPLNDLSLELEKNGEAPNPGLNQQLYRLHRIIGNMSDAASGYSRSSQCVQDLRSIFAEVLEKSRDYLEKSGISLCYKLPEHSIYALADQALLQRSIYNLISNACKFSLPGSQIRVTVRQSGQQLYCAVSNETHLPQADIFFRYQRAPGLEDPRFGIGLGLSLVQTAAAAHGGTVMVQKEGGCIKITMGISLKQSGDTPVHTPILRPDIYGGRDQALIELSDVLSAELYK